jgi:flagellar assembly protein FliH
MNAWTQLEQLGTPRSESVDPTRVTETLTVEQIEVMQQQAFNEAFEQGRVQGYEAGLKQGMEKGHEDGFAEGHKLGYQEGQHLLQKQAADLNSLLETLSEPIKQLDQEIENELVQLSLAVASQIIRREIKLHPDEIVAVVREAMNVLPLAAQKVTLNLHPEDAELVRNLLNLDDSLPSWRLVDNPLLTRGGCTLETETSSVDASLERRLAAVIANVLGGERQQDEK